MPRSNQGQSGREKCEAEGRCRICGITGKPLTRHHLVPQHWFVRRRRVNFTPKPFSRNDSRNIVPLCSYCHQRVEGDRGLDRATKERRKLDARLSLRRSLSASEVNFIVLARGRDWLDHHYPLDASEARRVSAIGGDVNPSNAAMGPQ